MNIEVRKYMASIGAKGGKAGKGKADRKEICRKAAQARWAKYHANKEKPDPQSYTTADGLFYVGYIATPDDMVGKLEPFKPCWNVQYLPDGTQEFFATKRECQAWIREWRQI